MSDEDERDDAQDETSSSDDAGAGPNESARAEGGDSDGGASDADDAAAGAQPYSDEAPASAATKVKSKGAASAGARLAAAKAAKAAAKAAKKQARKDEAGTGPSAAEREAEARADAQSAEDVLKESPLGRAATRAGEWTQAHRQLATGVAAVALLALVGWLGWSWYATSRAASSGALLQEALEISRAEIVTADEGDHAADTADVHEDDAPTFESIEARNTAALAAYRRVSTEYPGSVASAWARLGEGRTLLAQGQYDEARTAYQAAFDASGDESVVAWQALEGVGATYEAQSDWEHATATYERLASLADHAYENVANYHLARMHAAAGDESAALSSFRELVDALREEGDDGEPPFPYVLAQADQRLRELDPSAQGAGPSLGEGGGSGGGLDGLTPEQIQELIQRLQREGGGGLPPE